MSKRYVNGRYVEIDDERLVSPYEKQRNFKQDNPVAVKRHGDTGAAFQYRNLMPSGLAGLAQLGQDQRDEEFNLLARQKAAADDFDAFIRTVMAFDENDPEVQRIGRMAQAKTLDAARMRGIKGPLSMNASQSNMQNALLDRRMAGQQLGAQLMGQRASYLGNLGALDQRAYEHDFAAKMQARQAEADAKNLQGQTWGTLIGGGLGALPGIFMGNPMVAGMGAQFGGQLGGGLGGSLSGGGIPEYDYTPTPRRGSLGSGRIA